MSSRKRLVLVMKKTGKLLGVCLFYAFLCMFAKRPLIPCPFRLITGLSCPGCGVTRMCLSLFHLDFSGAFRANPALMILLVPGAILAISHISRFIRTGEEDFTLLEKSAIRAAIFFLLLFGVFRNLVT